jgi:mRNA interferase RelE/StbE
LGWTVEIGEFAESQLMKLDRPVQERILNYLNDRIEGCKDPRHFGEALKGDTSGLWRCRVGDYRIICQLQQERLVILAIAIGHRSKIYK